MLLPVHAAQAQLRPELRPDEAPWVWVDAGNRLSTGTTLEFDLGDGFGFDIDAGYVTELGEKGLLFLALVGVYEPFEAADSFFELELSSAWDFAEQEPVWKALLRFVGLSRIASRTLALWIEAGYVSTPGIAALIGVDVPLLARRDDLGIHLFSVAGISTDGVDEVDAADVSWGARLSWYTYPCGRLEVALSAFAEHAWQRNGGDDLVIDTTVVVQLSLRWYPMWYKADTTNDND